jgi:cytoskeletal protein CcmA (bactofilin family)
MPDFHVQHGETAILNRVEGELIVGDHARIKAANGKSVVVTEGAYFDGGVDIFCNFECESMRVKGRGYGFGARVAVRGDLTVHGATDVEASLEVDGDLKSEDVDVGGHLKSKNVFSKHVRTGGYMQIEGSLEAESVDVGGHLSVPGNVRLSDLHVGGHAKVGGGVISGEIQVRGHFTVESKIEFGELKTFGHIKLPADSKGEKLLAFGKADFLGDAFCRVLQVKGVVKVAGDYSAENIEIDGKLEVLGSLNAAKRLEVYGIAEVKKHVKCDEIVVAGKFITDSAFVDGVADIDGEVEVARGLRAKSVQVRKGSKIVGPLTGEQVEIGKVTSSRRLRQWDGRVTRIRRMTEVQDVYGAVVRVGSYSRVKRVFAETVEMDDGSIADEVTYTKNLKLAEKCYLNKPPVKASTLPEFPP